MSPPWVLDGELAHPAAADGDWLGARDALIGWGITPSLRFATDLMASVAGGQQRGKAYAGQLAAEASVDAELSRLNPDVDVSVLFRGGPAAVG
jgi:hypothetical protein